MSNWNTGVTGESENKDIECCYRRLSYYFIIAISTWKYE